MIENSINVSDVPNVLISEATDVIVRKVSPFLPIFKALGVAVIFYLIYLFISFILRVKHRRRLKRVEEKVDLILDKLSIDTRLESKKKEISKEINKKKVLSPKTKKSSRKGKKKKKNKKIR